MSLLLLFGGAAVETPPVPRAATLSNSQVQRQNGFIAPATNLLVTLLAAPFFGTSQIDAPQRPPQVNQILLPGRAMDAGPPAEVQIPPIVPPMFESVQRRAINQILLPGRAMDAAAPVTTPTFLLQAPFEYPQRRPPAYNYEVRNLNTGTLDMPAIPTAYPEWLEVPRRENLLQPVITNQTLLRLNLPAPFNSFGPHLYPTEYKWNTEYQDSYGRLPSSIPPPEVVPVDTTSRVVPAGKSKRHHRYIAQYKNQNYEFRTLEALEEFVAEVKQAEKPKPKAKRAPIKITLTPEFAEEIETTVDIPRRLESMPVQVALAQVRRIDYTVAQILADARKALDEDDEEAILWLLM